MRKKKILPAILLLFVALVALPEAAGAAPEPPNRPVVLVLVDGLSWEEVQREPALRSLFEEGSSATLSTVQGERPEAPRAAYLLLGAGSRTDTAVLPRELPPEPAAAGRALSARVPSIQPGSFGEALKRAGVRAAAIGEGARAVVMDRGGRVPLLYEGERPVHELGTALAAGVGFVAAEAEGPAEAGRLVEAAAGRGALVAVASPNAPPGAANLTPFAVSGRRGLLYSPSTRTAGLVAGQDVAPTLLARMGLEIPPAMQGRPVEVRPGSPEDARRLAERLSFVAEERHRTTAWALALSLLPFGASLLLLGRGAASPYLLALAVMPAATLPAAALPPVSPLLAAALITGLATSTAWVLWRLTGGGPAAAAAAFLTNAGVLAVDAASGGELMRFSILGYNPAYGARFYGIGNECSAILAGSLATGLGALAALRRPRAVPLALAGAGVVAALGMPTMGADVGGSLALGLGLGVAAGLVREGGVRAAAGWAAAGGAAAAALFAASPLLFPRTSHGSRAAAGEIGLHEMVLRKLELALSTFESWPLLLLLAVLSAVVWAGWRGARGTPLAAGLAGAALTAALYAALNDSGLLAGLYALFYPAVAGLLVLSGEIKAPR
ncbi:hypothetical protein Rxycam_01353 [Rubrobacter xylanophilus DSM 9941]|uniref:hypothetical protein n=1 Tax=Rubrobacter xylanophilus TaxID=49319 RepID=UPI001C641177|nr:hypothetical protein [Rubrobacter xylanophilus]QYJ15529.1 hypothetical protein Rxycam_01353 [Rubrobacter xylanophilus DSM 9941]